GGEHAKKVAARKEQHVAWYRADATDHAISPRSDLLGRLPSRTAVPEQLPIWMFRVDVNRAQAFVFAIVPFQKVSVHYGCGAKSGELASASCSLQGARKHLGERDSLQPVFKPAGNLLAVFRKRKIGPSRMLGRKRPSGLAMPGQINYGELAVHSTIPATALPLRAPA